MNRIDPNITFLYNLRALLKLSIVVPDPDTINFQNHALDLVSSINQIRTPQHAVTVATPRCSGSGNRCQINGISPILILFGRRRSTRERSEY